ncbi:MAG TPA: hypothetical protein PLR18_01960 [bacterium]|nr:hypothetical protein [bacterium]
MRRETLSLVEIIFRQEGITTKRVPSDKATLVVIRLNMAGYPLIKEKDITRKTARDIAKKINPNWLTRIFHSLLNKIGRTP